MNDTKSTGFSGMKFYRVFIDYTCLLTNIGLLYMQTVFAAVF